MSRCVRACWLLTACALTWCSVVAEQPQRQAFFRLRGTVTDYHGPGQDATAADVSKVKLAFFGPSEDAGKHDVDPWHAAQLAVEHANRQRGESDAGLPLAEFSLHPVWSDDPWGTGVAQLTRLVYGEQVWGIIGGVDGPSTHLAEQVVAKARLTLISPIASDSTVNLANVPWMFSCCPQDHSIVKPMTQLIGDLTSTESWVLLSSTDHDSHLLAVELRKHVTPRFHIHFDVQTPEYPALARRVVAQKPSLVVVIAGPRQSGQCVDALHGAGYSGRFLGGPSMARRAFELDSSFDPSISVPLPCQKNPTREAFDREFADRFGHQPDWAAAMTYDATNIMIQAVRQAGLNRVRIREAVSSLSPWPGITGKVTWDGLGSNTRAVVLEPFRQQD